MNYFDILLAKKLAGGGDVTIEPLTATDNGTYSEQGKAYSPVTVAVPLGTKSITANGTYDATDDSLKGYSSVSVDVPLPENAYLKKDLPAGAIATVTDAEAEVMPSLKIAITPVQEGSGDPSPTNIRPISGWSAVNVTRTGKNLFDKDTVTFAEGFITSTGEVSTAIHSYEHSSYIKVNPNTNYVFSGDIIGANLVNAVAFYNSKKEFISRFAPPANTPASFTTPNNCVYIVTNVYNIKQVNTIQLEEGTTATTYEPYNGTTYTTALKDGQGNPMTCYGGELSNVNGVQTLDNTHAYAELSENWDWKKSSTYQGSFYVDVSATLRYKTYTPFMCSHAKTINNIADYVYGSCLCEGSLNFWLMSADASVQDWKDYIVAQRTNGTPIGIRFELATPTQIPQQSQAIASQEGTNNLWADTGDILEGKYWSKNPVTVTLAMLNTLRSAGEITEITPTEEQEEPEEI